MLYRLRGPIRGLPYTIKSGFSVKRGFHDDDCPRRACSIFACLLAPHLHTQNMLSNTYNKIKRMRGIKATECFVRTLGGLPRWKTLLLPDGGGSLPNSTTPQVFKMFSGRKLNTSELRLLNEMMLDWHIHMKRQHVPPGTYPFYNWKTHVTKFFALWDTLKVVHNFQCKLDNFSGFDGAVLDFLHRTIHDHDVEWSVG